MIHCPHFFLCSVRSITASRAVVSFPVMSSEHAMLSVFCYSLVPLASDDLAVRERGREYRGSKMHGLGRRGFTTCPCLANSSAVLPAHPRERNAEHLVGCPISMEDPLSLS